MHAELLANASTREQDVLIVDVGGGKGHDLEKFSQQFPAAKGRLILQDLPPTLEGIAGLDANVELLPHDFFHAQPILGKHLPHAAMWWVRLLLTLSFLRRSSILHAFRLPRLGR